MVFGMLHIPGWRRLSSEALERLRALAGFMRFLEEGLGYRFRAEEEFEKRLPLQKYVFLARRLGLDLGYRFTLYLYGPYSPALANDYYELARRGDISPAPLPDGFDLEGFLALVGGRDATWLEVASSIILVEELYPGISEEDAYGVLKLSKPWLDRPLFAEICGELRGRGLIG